MPTICAGIDLGTSNTSGCVFRNGKPDVIALEGSSHLLPSCYAYNNGNKTECIGSPAKTYISNNQHFGIWKAKRMIGVPFNSFRVQNNRNLCHAPIREAADGGVEFFNDTYGISMTPTDVAAKILQKVKEKVETFTDCDIDCAVVTIPAGFTVKQREETEKAIEKAGFEKGSFAMIDEPTASAIAFMALDHVYEGYFVMFDIGGGTFDVSVVGVKNGHISIISHCGDESIGGVGIDKKIAKFIDEQCLDLYNHHIMDPTHRRAARNITRLMSFAERAKIDLTQLEATDLDLSAFSDVLQLEQQGYDPYDCAFKLSKAALTRLVREDVNLCVTLMHQAILECGLTKDDITAVVLVGGTCRLDYVKTALKEYFKRSVVRETVNPDEAVCIGACLYAHSWRNNRDQPFFLLDGHQMYIDQVVTRGIGIELAGGVMHTVIPKGTPLERKTFHVCVDTPDTKTRVMKTVLYQGNNPRVRNNTLLKEIEWSGFPGVRNYVVKFVIFITLASKDSIVVRVEDRVNKQVYLADTEILI